MVMTFKKLNLVASKQDRAGCTVNPEGSKYTERVINLQEAIVKG